MQLTKTDFIHYLQCPKSFWLLKNDPDAYPHGEFSLFMQKLVRDGYEVEAYVKKLFAAEPDRKIDYQTEFKTDDGLYARADAFEVTDDDLNILYEIKSSTSVKTSGKHDQIKDACFQKICAEKSGAKIHQVYLIHLNGGYVREGDIEPEKLLTLADITAEVADIYADTLLEVEAALDMVNKDHVDQGSCSCLFKTRSNQCDSFALFNKGVPKPSIYSLPRISANKVATLVQDDIFDLDDVAEDFELTDKQSLIYYAHRNREPQIDLAAIKGRLEGYEFPLYFFDYETYASSIPMVDGASPHKHFPVQYSLHILHADGQLEHKEFLQREEQLPRNLVEQMEEDFGAVGSVVSWHMSFEKTQNKNMAEWFPDKAEFLMDLNNRMVDLEDFFKADYVDAAFDGSTSIKKVLPVVCPHLSYDILDVQNGSEAMDTWQRMMHADPAEADKMAKGLLSYCKLDTFAMVEIYRFLKGL